MYKGIYGSLEADLLNVGKFKRSKIFVINRIIEISKDKKKQSDFLYYSHMLFMNSMWSFRSIRSIMVAKHYLKSIVYKKNDDINCIDEIYMNKMISEIIEHNKKDLIKNILKKDVELW